MKKTVFMPLFLLYLLLIPVISGVSAQETFAFKPGDIVFQKLTGGQNTAIELVTGSPYTHCAIIMEHDGGLAVYESIRLVGWKDMDDWIARGVDGHYVVMRLKDDSILTPAALNGMMEKGNAFKNKIYDFWFQWSDKTIYCSELVWKMYDYGVGIQLTELRPFESYANMQHPEVQKLIKQRFAGFISMNELAAAPSDLMESPLLEVVYAN